MNKLFDDQLIECAKNNYNKGRLSALKDEKEFLNSIVDSSATFIYECNHTRTLVKTRLASIQEEIKLIENAGVGK